MQTWPMIKMLLTSPGFQVPCTVSMLADSLQQVRARHMPATWTEVIGCRL